MSVIPQTSRASRGLRPLGPLPGLYLHYTLYNVDLAWSIKKFKELKVTISSLLKMVYPL
jgi:hypothetical protein